MFNTQSKLSFDLIEGQSTIFLIIISKSAQSVLIQTKNIFFLQRLFFGTLYKD